MKFFQGDNMHTVRLGKDFHFDAAHFLPDYEGACARLHGHRWNFQVILEGEVEFETKMLMDFNVLKVIVKEKIEDVLDHRMLNDLADTVDLIFQNPTAERIVKWIFDALKDDLPMLHSIKLWESPGSWVLYGEK